MMIWCTPAVPSKNEPVAMAIDPIRWPLSSPLCLIWSLTSIFRPLSSDLWPLTSDLCPLTGVFGRRRLVIDLSDSGQLAAVLSCQPLLFGHVISGQLWSRNSTASADEAGELTSVVQSLTDRGLAARLLRQVNQTGCWGQPGRSTRQAAVDASSADKTERCLHGATYRV